MPHKSGRSGHKQKSRGHSPKRRKSSPRRKYSVKHNGTLREPATSNGDPAPALDKLMLHGSDVTIQSQTVAPRSDVIIQTITTPSSCPIVSPDSYKQYARNVLDKHRDSMCSINDTLSDNNKLDFNSPLSDITKHDVNDADSVCSVSSYTRNRIDKICDAGKNPGGKASMSSDASDGIQAFIIPNTDQIPELCDVDVDVGDVSIVSTDKEDDVITNVMETIDDVISPPVDTADDVTTRDVNSSTVDQVCEGDVLSDRLSTDDSDFGADSRQKTLDWLKASDQRPDKASNWWENETLEQRYAKEKENFKQTNRIQLHVPQVSHEVTSQQKERNTPETREGNNLSVVLTNSVNRISKSSNKPINNSGNNIAGYNKSQPQTKTSIDGSHDGVPVPRGQRPASAHVQLVKGDERHAELQQQSEELLRRRQEMMQKYRLQRWIPLIPDTIDIDDLIIVNTIRKEMYQVSKTGVNQGSNRGHP